MSSVPAAPARCTSSRKSEADSLGPLVEVAIVKTDSRTIGPVTKSRSGVAPHATSGENQINGTRALETTNGEKTGTGWFLARSVLAARHWPRRKIKIAVQERKRGL